MTTKIKTTLLTLIFIFGLQIGLQAQDKFEYAVISYHLNNARLSVSLNGTEFKKLDVSKSEIQDYFDVNPALKEVSKMNTEGWEVFNTGTLGANNVVLFYLRKKKN